MAFIRLKILGAAFHYCPEERSNWLKCNFHFIRHQFLPSRVGIFPWYFFYECPLQFACGNLHLQTVFFRESVEFCLCGVMAKTPTYWLWFSGKSAVVKRANISDIFPKSPSPRNNYMPLMQTRSTPLFFLIKKYIKCFVNYSIGWLEDYIV